MVRYIIAKYSIAKHVCMFLLCTLNAFGQTVEKPKQKINMVEIWLKEKKNGSQPFVIQDEHEETAGVLAWDLEANTWQFQYPNTTWEIKNGKLYKNSTESSKSYPCTGFSLFLTNPIETWPDILEKKEEICNEHTCFLLVYYNKKPMIWKYSINPFTLLSVAIEDSASRYYNIDFQVTQEEETIIMKENTSK